MLGPIFSVELLTNARRGRYFLLRTVYAGILFLALTVVSLIVFNFTEPNSFRAGATFGLTFFRTFSWLQMLAVLTFGPALTAGAVAKERERRTVEYLFTTHLTNWEIVFGKLAAAFLQIASVVAVGAPVFALAMLMGGIEPEALIAVFLLTLSTILAVVSISFVASVASRSVRQAVAIAYVLLAIVLAGPPLLDALLGATPVGVLLDPAFRFMARINPLAVLGTALNSSAGAQAGDRWAELLPMIATQLALAFLALIWSAWALRRLHFASVGGAKKRDEAERRWLRPQLGRWPMIWKEVFAGRSASRLAKLGRGAIWAVVVLTVLGISLYFLDCMARGAPRDFIELSTFLGTILGTVTLLLMAAWGANSVAGEREQDTWLVLVSTPLEASEVLAGKLLGSIYAARIALIPLPVLWLYSSLAEPGYVATIPFTLSTLAVLAVSFSAMGMYFSMWCETSTRALGATLGVFFALTVTGCLCAPLLLVSPIALLVVPSFVYQIGTEAQGRLATAAAIFGIMWAIGLGIHVLMLLGVWSACVSRFDLLAGRQKQDQLAPHLRPRMDRPAEGIFIATSET